MLICLRLKFHSYCWLISIAYYSLLNIHTLWAFLKLDVFFCFAGTILTVINTLVKVLPLVDHTQINSQECTHNSNRSVQHNLLKHIVLLVAVFLPKI